MTAREAEVLLALRQHGASDVTGIFWSVSSDDMTKAEVRRAAEKLVKLGHARRFRIAPSRTVFYRAAGGAR